MKLRALIFTALLVIFGVGARAAGLSVGVDVNGVQLRMNAPISVPVHLQWPGPGLLEGRLEIELLRRGRVVGVTQMPPVFLSAGKRSATIVLPPPPGMSDGDTFEIRVRFLAKSGVVDAGGFPLGSVQLGGAKELVLCVVHTDRPVSEFAAARERSIWLESHLPRLPMQLPGHVTTRQTSLRADELPTNPAVLCSYDALFLDGHSFAQLSEKQMSALSRWVRAGGNLMVTPGDETARGFSKKHELFLNRMFASSGFRAGIPDDGRLTLTSRGTPLGTARVAVELGRVVVVNESEANCDLDGPVWHSSVAWLWKAERGARVDFSRDHLALLIELSQGASAGADMDAWVTKAAAGFAPFAPEAPRQVPYPVLISILAALLFAVAPGEWLLLGKLRRRRWTWVLFPMTCIGCTWLMSGLARKYVGFQDRAGSLRIVDVGSDGRVIRDVRFAQFLPSSERIWTQEARDGLVASLERRNVEDVLEDSGERAFEEAPPESEWLSSERFVLRRSLRQWTPALVRVTSFPDCEEDSGLDWSVVQALAEKAEKGQTKMQSFGDWTIGNSAGLSELRNRGAFDSSEARTISDALVTRPHAGNYGLISRLAPSIGGHFADLAVHSPDEISFVAAWQRKGTELVIYRRYIPVPPAPLPNYRDQ